MNLTGLLTIMLSIGLQVKFSEVKAAARPTRVVVLVVLANYLLIPTTSSRNAAVGLAIVTSNFAGTPAVTAVVANGLLSIVGTLVCALLIGKLTASHPVSGPEGA